MSGEAWTFWAIAVVVSFLPTIRAVVHLHLGAFLVAFVLCAAAGVAVAIMPDLITGGLVGGALWLLAWPVSGALINSRRRQRRAERQEERRHRELVEALKGREGAEAKPSLLRSLVGRGPR